MLGRFVHITKHSIAHNAIPFESSLRYGVLHHGEWLKNENHAIHPGMDKADLVVNQHCPKLLVWALCDECNFTTMSLACWALTWLQWFVYSFHWTIEAWHERWFQNKQREFCHVAASPCRRCAGWGAGTYPARQDIQRAYACYIAKSSGNFAYLRYSNKRNLPPTTAPFLAVGKCRPIIENHKLRKINLEINFSRKTLISSKKTGKLI